ncbi:MAG: collagenase-like protease, partial [Candidatus Electrothrix sp. AR3]|nr:collagenase-like protease [Candidatus Electrothrix sp. AR3]
MVTTESIPPGTAKQASPELLAPAGNMEKLITAVHYGADAVYLGGQQYS